MKKPIAIAALICLGLLAGCGRSQPAQTAAGAAANPAPQPTATPAEWQPPAPSWLSSQHPTPQRMPDPARTIEYQVTGFTYTYSLEITDGRAGFWAYGTHAAETLAPELLDRLEAGCAALDFDRLNPEYIEQPPPGSQIIYEHDYRTIGCNLNGRMRTVKIAGDIAVPPEVLGLEAELAAIGGRLRAAAPTLAPRLIGYFYDVGFFDSTSFHIDTTGAVYYGYYRAGQLEPEELAELIAFFEGPGFAKLAPAYQPPRYEIDDRDANATVVYGPEGREKKVRAWAGAVVPPVLQDLLERMAAIADRFRW